MNKKIQIGLPIIIAASIIAGILIGYQMNKNFPGRAIFSLDKKRTLQEVLDLIENKYVDDISMNKLGDTAIMAILSKLDPHSVFIPAEELKEVNESMMGEFYGIGIQYEIFNDTVNVVDVVSDGPSAKAGILIGDQIIKADSHSIAGKKLSSSQIRNVIRGEEGSSVTLQILRQGKVITSNITRGVIPIKSIDAAYMIDKQTGFIRINGFNKHTYQEFMYALQALQKKGLKKLILDLRDNGGGLLDEATAIADEFLDGDKLITYTEGKHFPKKEYRCKKPGLFETGNLIVLSNEGSASASEIIMGALQDWDRATIIGTRSFGKGLVQEQYDLSDGSAVRLTIARYFTPLGRSIQRSYENGQEAYYQEANHRKINHAVTDSSHIVLSPKGKKLFSKGGITPEIEIASDSIMVNAALIQLYEKDLVDNFAYHYFKENNQRLKSIETVDAFSQNFSFTDQDWNALRLAADKDSINIEANNVELKKFVNQQMKWIIAKYLWKDTGYFQIRNKEDKTILKALELLK